MIKITYSKVAAAHSRITLETIYFIYVLLKYFGFTDAAFMARNRSTEQRGACSRQSEV
jgi:hypothetical protein